jgi:hypothetical protein
MNVYPVNAIGGATSFTGNTQSFSDIKNTIHRYMKHRAWFAGGLNPQIQIQWASGIKADTFILADTNCLSASITIYYNQGIPRQINASLSENEEIKIWDIEDERLVTNISIILTAPANVLETYLGYLYVGNKMALPWFTVNPTRETTIRGTSERTNNGQAYGTIVPTLDQLSVSFVRIYKDKKKIVDDYIQAVQTTIPHVVDLYPEAHKDFPPRYATISNGISAVKRGENDFYWDFSLAWTEAK